MSANFKISLAKLTTLTQMDGQSVLFSKISGDFYGLNESANFLVTELLKSDFESTVKTASHVYQAPLEEIRNDFLETLASLERMKYIERLPVK